MSEILCKVNKNNKNTSKDVLNISGFYNDIAGESWILDNTAVDATSSSANRETIPGSKGNPRNHFFYRFGGNLIYNKNNKYYTIDTTQIEEDNTQEIKLNNSFSLNPISKNIEEVHPGGGGTERYSAINGIKIRKSGYYKLNSRLNVKSNSNNLYAGLSVFKFRPFIYSSVLDKNNAEIPENVINTYEIVNDIRTLDSAATKSYLNEFFGKYVYRNNSSESDVSGKRLKYDKNWNNLDYIRNESNWEDDDYFYSMLFPDGAYNDAGFYFPYEQIAVSRFLQHRPYYCIASSQIRTIPNYYLPLTINSEICYLNEGDILYLVYSARNQNTSNSYIIGFYEDNSLYFSVEAI